MFNDVWYRGHCKSSKSRGQGKREAAITGELRRKFGGGVLNNSLSHVISFYRKIFIACGDYVSMSWWFIEEEEGRHICCYLV